MKDERVKIVGNDLEAQAISGTLAVVLRGLIDLSRIWINKIENAYGRETLLNLADAFKKTVTAISDADVLNNQLAQPSGYFGAVSTVSPLEGGPARAAIPQELR